MPDSSAFSFANHLSKSTWLLLALLLLVAMLVRILPLTYSHFWDETVYLQHARIIVDGRSNYDEFLYRPPLLPLLYALGFVVHDDLYTANVVQGIVTSGAVLFAFLYVRRAFGVAPAICAALLFAFTPYLVERSHELLTDMPAVTLMLAAIWLFDKPGAGFALLSGVAYALAVQSRFTSLFLLGYFILVVCLWPTRWRHLIYLALGAAITIAPYLIWVDLHYGSFLIPFAHARRIVTEWTAPVPASFYFHALREIFPINLWLFFGVGTVTALSRLRELSWSPGTLFSAQSGERSSQLMRQAVLLIWGVAFFAYMLTIPHKEVRYLLPLAIPVIVISSLGIITLYRWAMLQAAPVKIAALLFVAIILVVDDAAALKPLAGPVVDESKSATVQIAEYLRDISSPADTIYAAHDFPVLAFYSGRRTVSLLTIQEQFEDKWRRAMTAPGFLVDFNPARITEIHAINALKPDRVFLDANPNFRAVRVFPTATVYRYEPAR